VEAVSDHHRRAALSGASRRSLCSLLDHRDDAAPQPAVETSVGCSANHRRAAVLGARASQAS
jgi:hypothetical protein